MGGPERSRYQEHKLDAEKAANVKARADAAARVQEYECGIEVLKGENNNLVSFMYSCSQLVYSAL
jgi:hypothetical protein